MIDARGCNEALHTTKGSSDSEYPGDSEAPYESGNSITQRRIAEYPEKDYGMIAERKAIKHNPAEFMVA